MNHIHLNNGEIRKRNRMVLTPKPFARSSEIVLYKDNGTDFIILKITTSTITIEDLLYGFTLCLLEIQ